MCDSSEYIIVNTKFGRCRVRRCHYNNGHIPTIQTALDKNLYFENQSRIVHGDKYSYENVNYINAVTKVIINCKKHGDFYQTPNSHLQGKGCNNCAKESRILKRRHSNKYFIDRSDSVHGGKYDYSKSNYIGSHSKIRIICPIHGEFEQIAKDHMIGRGCIKCGRLSISKHRGTEPTGWSLTDWKDSAKKSVGFDSYKCYIIKVFDDKESFIKIGRTYLTVQKRFRTKCMLPYNYEVLNTIVGDPKFIMSMESEIKRKLKNFKYSPNKYFNGKDECFTLECLENL